MRLKRGINQDVMANLVNMTQATYSRKERGLTAITATEWDKMAEVLGVDKYEIYENSLRNSQMSGNMIKLNTFIPQDLLEQIDILKKENLELKEELRKLKSKEIKSLLIKISRLFCIQLELVFNDIKSLNSSAFFQTESFFNHSCRRVVLVNSRETI